LQFDLDFSSLSNPPQGLKAFALGPLLGTTNERVLGQNYI